MIGLIKKATPLHVGHNIPYIAHQKLSPHIVAVPATRTPRSIIWAELNRIHRRSRPHLSYVPKEDFLNDHSIVAFDDEARHIRAQTNSLLRRINTPVLRPSRPLPISLSLTYNRPELPVPERITSDDYIHRMLEPARNVPYDIAVLSYYPGIDPTRVSIGKGHLACVTYAGGRGYPRRRYNMYSDNKNIKDEITFRSYYKSLENPGQAAEVEKWKLPHMEYRHAGGARKYKLTMSAPLVDSRGLPLALAKRSREEDEALEKKHKAEKEQAAKEWKKEQEKLAEERKKAEEEKKAEEVRVEAERQAKEKLAEEARKAEEVRLAEEARLAEERKKAEDARLAAEKLKAEEKKKAEEVARKAEEAKKAEEAARKAEEAKKAEDARIAEEIRLAEEAQKAEEARLAEESNLAEQARLAEEEHLAEEARLAEELKKSEEEAIAAVSAADIAQSAEDTYPASNATPTTEEIVECEPANGSLAVAEETELNPATESSHEEVKAASVDEPSIAPEPTVEEPKTPEVQNNETATSPSEVTSEEE